MIVDGKKIADEMLENVKTRVSRLSYQPKVLFYAPAQSPATQSYLKIKEKSATAAGFLFEETTDPTFFTQADAGIVQLPLPAGVDVKTVLNVIPEEKDADVLSDAAREKFERGDIGALLPPVVGAIAEIFSRYNVDPKGKRASIIGAGFLVGDPVAIWLRQQGADVQVLTRESFDPSKLKEADIIVSGAGVPHLIKPEMLKQGVVLIDAGTSESNGAIAGDADPACAEVASVFTPVPGGVGPIAVACLFKNTAELLTRGG